MLTIFLPNGFSQAVFTVTGVARLSVTDSRPSQTDLGEGVESRNWLSTPAADHDGAVNTVGYYDLRRQDYIRGRPGRPAYAKTRLRRVSLSMNELTL